MLIVHTLFKILFKFQSISSIRSKLWRLWESDEKTPTTQN